MNAPLPRLDMIDLVIFDCDGVIADSEVIANSVLTAQLTGLGLPIEPGFVSAKIVGKSFPTVIEIVRDSFGVTLPDTFGDRYWQALSAEFSARLQPTPGFASVLDGLGCASCVASNSGPVRVAKTLELLGYDGFFGDRVFTASMVARGKPAPDLHLFAASQMSASPQNVLVLEDSDTGVDAALSAGMQVWRYTGGSHFTAERKAQLKQTSAVPVFDSWANFYIDAPELMKRE